MTIFVYISATSKSVKEPKSPDEFLHDNPYRLVSEDPAEYRNDVLAKIVPRILNPLGKRNFYDNNSNCPAWFPKSVTFRRPNHPKRIYVLCY